MSKYNLTCIISITIIIINIMLTVKSVEENEVISDNSNFETLLNCYCCDSNENIDCINNLENLKNSYCKCSDECAVSYVNDSVIRNCMSNIIQRPFEKITQVCQENFCNFNAIEISENNNINIFNNTNIENENNETIIFKYNNEVISIEQNSEENSEEIISCHRCNSNANNQYFHCLTNPMGLQSKVNCSSQCFTGRFNNTLIRGCLNDLNDTEKDQCLKGISCTICEEFNCNNKNWQFCYSCESNIEDFNCAQWYSTDDIPYEICENENDNCLIEINNNKQTIRGCTTEDEINKSDLRFICSENRCNKDIFPVDRIHCHQCSETKECALLQEMKNMRPCLNYLKEDKCFYYTYSGSMYRNCLSDNEKYENCKESSDTCLICNDKNGCNDQPLYKEPNLSCSICSKSQECSWHQNSNTIKPCQKKFLYFLKETCMTYSYKTGEAERDCTFDKGDCPDENCHKCNISGCNIKNLIYQKCYQCNSSIKGQEECANVVNGLTSELCQAENQIYSKRGCYILKKDSSIIRGCAYDLSDKDFDLCKGDNNGTCSYCPEMDCNNKKPNKAAIQTISIYHIYYVILILSFKYF